jgi:hypothetical protein
MKDDKPDNYPITLFLTWCGLLVAMLLATVILTQSPSNEDLTACHTTCAGRVLEVTNNACKCQPEVP